MSLAARDETTSLDSLISLAIRLDNRLRERNRERNRGRSSSLSQFRAITTSAPASHPSLSVSVQQRPPENSEEPMQLGRAHLTPAERQRCLRAGLCFYCGEAGHTRASCPQLNSRAHQ